MVVMMVVMVMLPNEEDEYGWMTLLPKITEDWTKLVRPVTNQDIHLMMMMMMMMISTFFNHDIHLIIMMMIMISTFFNLTPSIKDANVNGGDGDGDDDVRGCFTM